MSHKLHGLPIVSAVLPTVNKRDYPIVAEHIPVDAWEKMVERYRHFVLYGVPPVCTVWSTACLYCMEYCLFVLYGVPPVCTVWSTACLYCMEYCLFVLYGVPPVCTVWSTACLYCMEYRLFVLYGVPPVCTVWSTACLYCMEYCLFVLYGVPPVCTVWSTACLYCMECLCSDHSISCVPLTGLCCASHITASLFPLPSLSPCMQTQRWSFCA